MTKIKMRKKSLVGKVWSGFIGEYKQPPIYIIPTPLADGIFIDDFLRPFLRKKVCITAKEIK